MKHLRQVLVGFAVLLVACAPDGVTSIERDSANVLELSSEEVVRVQQLNERNQIALEALIAEVDPRVRYKMDGTWSAVAAEELSPAAAEFLASAQRSPALHTISAIALPGYAASLSSRTRANKSGITWYWWGARIAMPTQVASGISDAWSRSGGAAAIKVFLQYYGYNGWAVSAAGLLVPAYAVTINVIDRMGGRRGVFLNVPWSIIPTYITPQ